MILSGDQMRAGKNCGLIAIASIFFLSVPALCQLPAWVTTKEDVRFPDRLYMTGIGAASVGANREEAIKQSGNEAFAEIAKQLRANISDVSTTKTIEVSSSTGRADVSSEAKADLRVSTDLTLGGLKVVDTYYDRGNRLLYSLAVLNRAVVGSELKDKLRFYLENYRGSVAQVSRKDLNILQVISGLAVAHSAVAHYNSLQPVYHYIVSPLASAGSSWDMPGSISGAFIDEVAQSVLVGISLRKIGGEAQEVKLGRVLRPLVMKAEYTDSVGRSHPVPGLRITFKFVNGTGDISRSSTTDSAGVARCEVYSLTPYASTFYTIRAVADFDQFDSDSLAPADSWKRYLDAHPVETTFSLVKTRLTLDDELRQLVASMASNLGGTEWTVCISRIDFQGKVPGELSEYLRQHIETTVRQTSGLRLMSMPTAGRPAVSPVESSDKTGELSPELASAAGAGIGLVLTGSYWQRRDATELDLNAVDTRSGAILASASVDVPQSVLPDLSLAPANYQAASDDSIIANRNSGSDVKVNLWVNHPDGVYHDGDTLSIYLSANKDVYVELVYVDASGQSLLMFPDTYEWNNRLKAGRVYTIPDPLSDGILRVEPPFGREIIKAYVSGSPFPIPGGTKSHGLVVLNSIQSFQTAARGIGLISKAYGENSIVVSTFPDNK